MRRTTRNRIFFVVSISVLFFSSACSAQQALPFYGEVTADNINVRADSTVSSEAVCALNKGSRVEVLAELYDWYKIRLPKNVPAYIKKDFLECVSYKSVVSTAQTAPMQPVKECLTAKLLNDRVNVRLHPDTGSKILGIVNKNDTVMLSGESAEWYRIEPPLNTFGFISKQFVKQAAAVTTAVSPAVNPSQAPSDALIALEGVVQPYGKFFNRPATHKLVTADNTIYLLRGDKNSLNALNYKKVSVTGTRVQVSEQKYPVVEVKTLEIAK